MNRAREPLCRLVPVVVVLLGMLSPAPRAAPKIQVVQQPDFEWSEYASYRLRAAAPAGRPEVQRWIEEAIDEQLAQRGLAREPEGRAQLEVVSYALLRINAEVWGNFIGTHWGGNLLQVQARDVGEGALILQIRRPDEERSLWSGLIRVKVDAYATNEQIRAKVDRAVKKLFKKKPQTNPSPR